MSPLGGDTIKSAARMVQRKLPDQPRAEREPTGHHSLSVPISKALPLTASRNAEIVGPIVASRWEVR
jgi:hypothetical protein